MRDVVGRISRAGEITAQQLMAALSTRFDTSQLLGDGEVDRLVIASFKMQEGQIANGAPVAAIQCRIIEEIERARDIAAAKFRHDQQNLLTHALPDAAEEFPRQIGWIPFLISGGGVAVEEGVPDVLRQVPAGEPLKRYAVRDDSGALLAQVLPLRRRQ